MWRQTAKNIFSKEQKHTGLRRQRNLTQSVLMFKGSARFRDLGMHPLPRSPGEGRGGGARRTVAGLYNGAKTESTGAAIQ